MTALLNAHVGRRLVAIIAGAIAIAARISSGSQDRLTGILGSALQRPVASRATS
jgi:hypothetical protein